MAQQAILADTMEEAISEATAYARMGVLDASTLRNIALDYGVDEGKLRSALSYEAYSE